MWIQFHQCSACYLYNEHLLPHQMSVLYIVLFAQCIVKAKRRAAHTLVWSTFVCIGMYLNLLILMAAVFSLYILFIIRWLLPSTFNCSAILIISHAPHLVKHFCVVYNKSTIPHCSSLMTVFILLFYISHNHSKLQLSHMSHTTYCSIFSHSKPYAVFV